MANKAGIPVVAVQADIAAHAGETVRVEGRYEQEDVRMMRVNPETLYEGHVVIVLGDDCRVFVYPPASPDARRPKAEIERFEHRMVGVVGTILQSIPQEGAVQQAPCLMDLQSIAAADCA